MFIFAVLVANILEHNRFNNILSELLRTLYLNHTHFK